MGLTVASNLLAVRDSTKIADPVCTGGLDPNSETRRRGWCGMLTLGHTYISSLRANYGTSGSLTRACCWRGPGCGGGPAPDMFAGTAGAAAGPRSRSAGR